MAFSNHVDLAGNQYKGAFYVEKDVLIVIVSGKRISSANENKEVSLLAYQTVKERCLNEGLKKILIVSEVTGNWVLAELKAIVDSIKARPKNANQDIQVALVDTNYGSHLDNIFIEQEAISNGSKLRVFHTEIEGREWIGLAS